MTKLLKYFALVLLMSFLWSNIYAQQTKAVLRLGALYYDARPDKQDVLGWYADYGTQIDVGLEHHLDWSTKIKPHIAVGYSLLHNEMPDGLVFRNAGEYIDAFAHHHIHLGYGLAYRMGKRITLSATAMHYVFVGELYGNAHRRTFMNLDAGISIQVGRRSSLTLDTPLTITRMLRGAPTAFLSSGPGGDFIPQPEVNGLYIGWTYSLSKPSS